MQFNDAIDFPIYANFYSIIIVLLKRLTLSVLLHGFKSPFQGSSIINGLINYMVCGILVPPSLMSGLVFVLKLFGVILTRQCQIYNID